MTLLDVQLSDLVRVFCIIKQGDIGSLREENCVKVKWSTAHNHQIIEVEKSTDI